MVKKRVKKVVKKKVTRKHAKVVHHKKAKTHNKHKHSKIKNTALKKYKVSSKKNSARVKTGIKGFDKLIGGGFEEESINLISGGNGSGKTIFAMQFLIEGMKRGENVLYITFEESKEEFYSNMKQIGWDLAKYEQSGKLTFLEYSPEKVKMMLDEGGGAIESIVIRKKIKRLIIDSISSFSFLFENPSARRQGILSLFDIIRKWDCTSLFTLQKDPLENTSSSSSEIQSDSLINLYHPDIKGKREHFIEVIKMRGTKHANQIYPFLITKGGIKVSSRPKKVKF